MRQDGAITVSAGHFTTNAIVFLVMAGIWYGAARPAPAQTTKQPAATLKVGDKAPPLVVEKWLKGEPVSRFRPGHVYVVEFWSTWCGTCVKSMPDLSELQRIYKDKVTIIAVNVWERAYNDKTLATVENFVAKQGDRMAYAVAYDGKARATDTAYMKAAERTGIPTTFLIDGNGKIAWIGYPWSLDVPLAACVAGKWDLVSGPQYLAQAEGLVRQFREKVRNTPQEALALWETLEREYPGATRKVAGLGFKTLLEVQEYSRAYKLASELVDRAIAAKDVRVLNALAWAIVDPEGKVETKDLDLALRAAIKADEFSKHENASVLDTLARVYFCKGEVDRAIELQTRAVAKGQEQDRSELRKTLEAYQAAKKQGSPPGQ